MRNSNTSIPTALSESVCTFSIDLSSPVAELSSVGWQAEYCAVPSCPKKYKSTGFLTVYTSMFIKPYQTHHLLECCKLWSIRVQLLSLIMKRKKWNFSKNVNNILTKNVWSCPSVAYWFQEALSKMHYISFLFQSFADLWHHQRM